MNFLTKIKMFFGNQQLVDALSKTIKLLENSEDSDWSSLTAAEIKEILKCEIHKIEQNQAFDKLELVVLFAATSNVQETAMSNGWNSEYLEIANVIDKFTSS